MRMARINYHLDRAAYFRRLSDPETNHIDAGPTTMLADKARARALYHEKCAADLLAEGAAKHAARKAPTKPQEPS